MKFAVFVFFFVVMCFACFGRDILPGCGIIMMQSVTRGQTRAPRCVYARLHQQRQEEWLPEACPNPNQCGINTPLSFVVHVVS